MAETRSAVRPWLSAYPPGIPAELDVDGLGTLVDLFEECTARSAARPALESFGARISYAALGASAEAVAAWLAAQGLTKGDRVAIMMPNVAAYPATIFGVLLAGCIVVNVNPLYTPRELTAQLNDSGARILFVLENFAHTVVQALPDLALDRVVLAGPGDGLGMKGRLITLVSRHVKKAVPAYRLPEGLAVRFDAMIRAGTGKPKVRVPVVPDDLAFLQYTGGTTGVAKAAMLTHRNIMANVEQSRIWFRVSAEDGAARVMVTALPLYHIFALTCCFFFFMKVGGCCLLIANPRDADGFIKTLKGTPFTHFSGVNTLFNLLINHPKIREVDFSRLDFVIAGGMAVQAAVAEKWKAITGRAIVEGYGLSETSPVVCVNPPDLSAWSGTIGYPLPSTDVSIRGLDGREVDIGEPGELCVRGPQVMAGYWKRPDETAHATTVDGYFRTGDVAVLNPDGQVRIVDRMKDMILVSGFNVYPNEIEDVLASHPGVLECAVVGAVNDETGEMVVAHVVRKDDAMTTDALRTFARSQLTGYKVPRRVVFHDALPKTNVGKVLRRALRDDPPPP
ncbi:long-chain fatty acid--CoA ligase [Methylobacterium sp. Leaf465]|uniref:AMP-binding protein n=1 Tax=unclassified Methylobacterium TaxID=2615210 RepID=UPI0006FCBA85|nr:MULTISPECIES: AMP-binding protein [unclassified Methylobacterium]KQO66891.1 long-chain fatty acid--CoA ligase [Methylobacterium sp. Leaf89]KQT84925.1 long-chain fatty acid--CoA ligase [Methylobacterium sp. Leaf465]